MNRIKTAANAALLLMVSATGLHAQIASFAENSSSAFESLKAYVSPAVFDAVLHFPSPAPCSASGFKDDLAVTGERLFQELHKAVIPSKPDTAGYKEAKAYMFSRADNVTCNGGPGILTFYSQVCVNGTSGNGTAYKELGDRNDDGVVDTFVNAEHIWPQGYFRRALPMASDLHQLASTFVTPNSRRSNLRFAKVTAVRYSTSAGSKLGKEGFEPADAVKGNAARAMLYFMVRYYDKNIRLGMNYSDFWISRVPLLLEWNRQDPPDAAERRRNDLVQAFQGNRNPFIDNPDLADRIGAAVFASH